MIVVDDRRKPSFLAVWLLLMMAAAIFVWWYGRLSLPGASFPFRLSKLLRTDYLAWTAVFWTLVAAGQWLVLRDRLLRPRLWSCGTLVGGLVGTVLAVVVAQTFELFLFRQTGAAYAFTSWRWLSVYWVATIFHLLGAVVFGLLLAAGQAIASGLDRRFVIRWMATLAVAGIALVMVQDVARAFAIELWRLTVSLTPTNPGLLLPGQHLGWIEKTPVLAGWFAFMLIGGAALGRWLRRAEREARTKSGISIPSQ